jgi:hypothetical protein
MTDNKDDTGKGPPRPGERRPYATIDLQATEVGGKPKGEGAASAAAGGVAKPQPRPQSLPPPGAGKTAGERLRFSERLATARGWSARAAQSNTFLSHVAAGVAGAVLTLAAAALLGLFSGGGSDGGQVAPEMAKRLAAVEQAVKQRTGQPGDASAKLAATDARVASLEERARALSVLSDAQAKLAAETKALEARVGTGDLTERLAKLEASIGALAAGDQTSDSARAALAAKLTELGEAAKSGSARVDRDLAVLKTEAGRLGQRLDALRGEVDERLRSAAKAAELAPLAAKLALLEQDLQGFVRNEGERNSNAQRVLLGLEIASLKRAMDRGERYTTELDAAKKAAGGLIDLAPLERYMQALERYMQEGVPTLPALSKDFRRIANAAIDAESEPADAGVLDRLVSGAKSIVRVRKSGHAAEDSSVEAVVGRMEAALKDGRLGDVLAQGKTLPPKAALAADGWLRKLEARYAVDRAVADIEAQLKSSLGAARGPAAEPKR